nr:LysM peptidoglycan-binding domain-containing protein [Ruminococcus sp.]
ITGISVSYNITSDGILNAKSDISVKISIGSFAEIKALTGIAIDDSTKKQRDGDYAIKLYFGTENEDIWDIAKRCSTEIDAVIEENELTSERLEKGGMLIIPIKE